MNKSDSHFAKTIKQLRKSLGLSQEEFGKKIGVAKTTICNYEKGVSSPAKRTLENLSIEFGMDISTFIDNPSELNQKVIQPIFGNVIPLYDNTDIESIAGDPSLCITRSIGIPLPASYKNDRCIATTVADNSMNKLGIKIGFEIVIDKDTPIHDNDIIAVIYNGKLSLRRYIENSFGKYICTESTKMAASLAREPVTKCDMIVGKIIKIITDPRYI